MMVNSLIEDTLERIDREYQAGTLAWIKLNRPEGWGKVLAMEGKVNELALESNLRGLREALNEYQGLILTMVKEFTLKEQGSFKFGSVPNPLGRVRGGKR